jgi:DNA repair exonuclease SbcCD nuclease subunit
MKIGILSDLHLEWRPELVWAIPDVGVDMLPSLGMPEAGWNDADVIVLAGDIHPDPRVRAIFRQLVIDAYGLPVVMPEGNHDFYGGTFPRQAVGNSLRVGDASIASCTLWTHLAPLDRLHCPTFSDFKHIKGATFDTWNDLHEGHLSFLQRSDAEIIVTHHAPSYNSVSAQYGGNVINCFFVNDIDMSLFPKAKLWIHGHVHSEHDYELPNGPNSKIRVVCNPLGYPFEGHRRGATMKVITI